jgi:hypothetical protein
LESPRLNSAVREALVEVSRIPGVTVVLVRRPPSVTESAEPLVLVAQASAREPRGVIAPQPDPAALHTWAASAQDGGDLPPLPGQREMIDPVLLVCTHSSRDACCAIEGRRLLTSLRDSGVAAWETSHLGGHRFAPTALLLPDGAVYGRLTVDAARAVVIRGEVDPEHLRGLSRLRPTEQAAEIAVRREIGDRRRGILAAADGPDGRVTVTHRDGRSWRVDVAQGEGLRERPESCGGDLSLATSLRCRDVHLIA